VRPVKRDPRPLEHRRQRGPCPAAERTHPRDELGEGERLGEVVVRAEVKAVHPVPDPGRRGQHQHAGLPARGEDPTADLVAVHERQVAVQDHHVVAVHHDALKRGVPVVADVDGHRPPPQSLGDRVGHDPLVLGHEHPHCASPSTSPH